jgi:predicted LPLAT superfamily acyltransferase
MKTPSWLELKENGSALGICILVFLCKTVGRSTARFVLLWITGYYVLFSSQTRAFSRAYLERIFPSVSIFMIYRHVLCFAQVSLDRILFAAGKIHNFQVKFHGKEHLQKLRSENKGALLLLAHLGSFDAGRYFSQEHDLPIYYVGYIRNAQKMNRALQKLNPQIHSRMISIDPGNIDFIFQIQNKIESGNLVALMGDRVGLDGKFSVAHFLGAPARFPAGPYQIAAILGCPIYMVFGLYNSPNQYNVYCEPFVEKLEPSQARNQEELQAIIQQYANRVEYYCRRFPYNWFNFFDFWRMV